MRTIFCTCMLLVATLVLPGCPGGSLGGVPEPTKKAVKPEDMIGKWQFKTSRGTVTLLFRPDGRLTQTVSAPKEASATTEGTWKLDSPNVTVEGYVSLDTGKSEGMPWYMVDDGDRLALFGGDIPDPDFWVAMKRLPDSD